MAFISHESASRDADWGTKDTPSTEQIIYGALARIATALETLTKDYDSLRRDRDRYKGWYEEKAEGYWKYQRSNAALRGVITRMKNRAAAGPEDDT